MRLARATVDVPAAGVADQDCGHRVARTESGLGDALGAQHSAVSLGFSLVRMCERFEKQLRAMRSKSAEDAPGLLAGFAWDGRLSRHL
jgi:hypothetical protein